MTICEVRQKVIIMNNEQALRMRILQYLLAKDDFIHDDIAELKKRVKRSPDDQDVYFWEAMTGRSTAYEYIVDHIDDLLIDPENSFVLVETVPYKDALSIANFIRYLKNANLVEEDGFDIEEYIY